MKCCINIHAAEKMNVGDFDYLGFTALIQKSKDAETWNQNATVGKQSMQMLHRRTTHTIEALKCEKNIQHFQTDLWG